MVRKEILQTVDADSAPVSREPGAWGGVEEGTWKRGRSSRRRREFWDRGEALRGRPFQARSSFGFLFCVFWAQHDPRLSLGTWAHQGDRSWMLSGEHTPSCVEGGPVTSQDAEDKGSGRQPEAIGEAGTLTSGCD